jgi:hypothetical protein
MQVPNHSKMLTFQSLAFFKLGWADAKDNERDLGSMKGMQGNCNWFSLLGMGSSWESKDHAILGHGAITTSMARNLNIIVGMLLVG